MKMLLTAFGEGRYHLIPSFFRTLTSLKKQKREFAVCFRTFGKDLPMVTWEFNQYCNGQHPCFSGRNGTPLVKFDGSKGTKDLRIDSMRQHATMYRFSHELKDTKLLQGISTRLTDDIDELNEILDSEEKYEDCRLISDPIQQYQHIIETLKKKATMVFQEDFKNWSANDKHREVAKLLLIDQADYQTQHIFFDDNADPDDDCIVDVRDVITKEVVPYKKFMNRYVVRVEPHRAILETDYFLRQIEQCERSRDEEIERVEAGIPDEEDQEEKEEQDGEW